MNLINNMPPTENINYEVSNGAIILPTSYKEYTKKIKNYKIDTQYGIYLVVFHI